MPRKITNRMITDRFIAAFERGKPFTPSEKRMMGIKLAALKKSIKEHLEATGRQTDLSIEQIIMDSLEYSVMTNKPYRSIASLGYEILDPSIEYWEKRRKLDVMAKEKAKQDAEKFIDVENNSKPQQQPQQPVHTAPTVPAWMNNNDW